MRTLLLIITTALLTAVWLLYAWQSNSFPEFFSLIAPVSAPEGEIAIASNGNPCTTPWWETIEHGKVFLSFAQENASIGSGGCESRSTICNDGSRSIDQEPFSYKSCSLETPKSCEVNNFKFAHWSSQTFYKLDAKKQQCTSQERSCIDGIVDGDDAYSYLSCPSSCPVFTGSAADCPIIGSWSTNCPECPCLPKVEKKPEVKPLPKTTIQPVTKTVAQPATVAQPNCASPFGWTRREAWKQGTAYTAAKVPYGSMCEQVSIVCAYGSIRYGTAANPWAIAANGLSTTCSVWTPVSCTSACGTINHGEQVTTYANALIPHGNGQTCDDTKIVSTCSNGTLSPSAWWACSCQIAPPAACTAPNWQTVAHGKSLTLYQYPTVQALAGDGSDTCVRQWRQCINGSFHDRNGNPASFTFKYPTCTVTTPPEGWGPGGEGVPVGQ